MPQAHRGCAFGDLNNNGRVDVVVTNLSARPEVFLNRSTNSNPWLSIHRTGTKSNRDGLGSSIQVVTRDGLTQFNHVTTSVGLSYASGRRVTSRWARIYWGGESRDRVAERDQANADGNVSADQVLTVREGATNQAYGVALYTR